MFLALRLASAPMESEPPSRELTTARHRVTLRRARQTSRGDPGARRDARAAPRPPRRRLRHLADAATREKQDRKSTRLNSSHVATSYAVFCLKKKNGNDFDRTDQTRLTKLSNSVPLTYNPSG